MGCRLLKMGWLRGVRASVGRKGVRREGVAGGPQSTTDPFGELRAGSEEWGMRKANAETLGTRRFAEVLGRGESSLQEAISL
jgi:hypothetical protein